MFIVDLPDAVLQDILCRAAQAYRRRAAWMLLAVCRRFRACLMSRATALCIYNDEHPPLEEASRLKELRLLRCTHLPPAMTRAQRFLHLTKLEVANIPYNTRAATFNDLTALPALEHLALNAVNGGNAVPQLLEAVARHTALKHLHVVDTVSDEEADLRSIAQLTSLERLGAGYCSEACKLLTSLRNLTQLSMDNCDYAQPMLVSMLSQLKALNFEGCHNIRDFQLADLSALTGLEHLNLKYCYRLLAGMSHLTGLTALTYLNLKVDPITTEGVNDEGVSHIVKITSLKHLVLDATGSLPPLSQLSSLKLLEHLDLKYCVDNDSDGGGDTDEAGLSWLSGLSKLTTLHLHPDLDDTVAAVACLSMLKNLAIPSCDAIVSLRSLTSLTCLRVDNGSPDQGMTQIGSLTQLRELGLGACSDGILQSLTPLRSLQLLHISDGREISDRGLAELSALTCLTNIELTLVDLPGDALARVASLPRLLELVLSSCGELTDAGLERLSRSPVLRSLVLNDIPQLAGTGFAALSAIAPLTRLFLARCPALGDDGLSQLSQLTGLEHLDVQFCRNVTGASLSSLGTLTNLLRLKLGESPHPQNANAERLQTVLPHLQFEATPLYESTHGLVGASLWLDDRDDGACQSRNAVYNRYDDAGEF